MTILWIIIGAVILIYLKDKSDGHAFAEGFAEGRKKGFEEAKRYYAPEEENLLEPEE